MSKSKNNAKSEYAKRLKAYRKAANVSQENLAKALDVHQPYIAAIELGTISLGIDKLEEIADFFGVKYYKLADPDVQIPSREDLRENISIYIKSKNIDPGYLNDDGPNYSEHLDLLLKTSFLSEPRTAKEISIEMRNNYQIEISASRISDILSRAPRKDQIVIEHAAEGNLNRYRLK